MNLRQRAPRIQSKSHLAFIRGLPCIACAVEHREAYGVDACHVRHAFPGWARTGMGQKSDDARTFPACRPHHDEQHQVGRETVWWARLGVNPVSLCADLVAAYPSTFNGREVILDHAARARRPITQQYRGGGLSAGIDLCPPSCTISGHIAGLAPDADGNVAVLVPLAAGDTLIVHVAPDAISRSDDANPA